MIVLSTVVLSSLIFLIVQKDSLKNYTFIAGLNSILNLVVLYIIIGSATFNNDWIAYENYYDGIVPINDLFYILGFQFFKFLNFTYLDFYLWNQLLIYVLVIFFITRFTSKYLFFVVITILIIPSPNFSILLRYYTAFAFFLVGLYNLRISNNLMSGCVFLLLAGISHFGAIILLGVFLIFKFFNIGSSLKPIFFVAFVLLFFQESLFGLINELDVRWFIIYITAEETSTLKGGLMAALPYLPWMFFVYLRHKKLFRFNKDVVSDNKYVFLYQLSLFPYFLIVLGIFTQIIQHRYVEPFAIVWCVFLCYTLSFEQSKLKKFLGGVKISILLLLSFYLKYFLPLTLIGRSEWLIHYIQLLNSNAYGIFKLSDFY